MHESRIAIVGIGLEYPDASTPQQLWENVLGGRRAFRDLPSVRTSLDDYWHPDPTTPDAFYSRKAAVLRDYEFDRVGHKVSKGTFGATDMTHWLALDVTGRALVDAGFPHAEGMPHARTSVIFGNTLTGEFTRANVMRLRWPYVRRTVAAQLREREWETSAIEEFIASLEAQYKAPFPRSTEDTLAGGLANTIAGRICNFFDFGGGGYTVDGACSSSLLAVTQSCSALVSGDADIAVAGGVDLSIDPFELVGFAKTGALAREEMLVYDADSNGFWPGEGCGVVILMREDDALDQGRDIYSTITGWGVSSDGRGGMTRPEAGGHRRAIDRAYHRAGYGSDQVGYFEGHGTGTAVGDATEIEALLSTRTDTGPAAALGSIKANIGHTKAAAGIAGLIKAALVTRHQLIPPVTGQNKPHPDLTGAEGRLYTPTQALPWPAGKTVRAGVSAMGFGGINTHIALEGAEAARGDGAESRYLNIVRGRQDCEVLLLAADDVAELMKRLDSVAAALADSAICELTDIFAVHSSSVGSVRVGVVASTVELAADRIQQARDSLANGRASEAIGITRVGVGCFVARSASQPKIALMFPGQGAGRGDVGAVSRRFGTGYGLPLPDGTTGTAAVQPKVVHQSLATLAALTSLGVEASVAIGHSLGELCALAWAQAFTAEEAISLAVRRGALMGSVNTPGSMAAVRTNYAATEALIEGFSASIAGFNSPSVTVIAGAPEDIAQIIREAQRRDIEATPLSVDHSFHTSDFSDCAEEFRTLVGDLSPRPPAKRIISTVTGEVWDSGTGIAAYFAKQMVEPVRFEQAVRAADHPDLIIEVGPGRSLSGLASEIVPDAVVVATDSDSPSLHPFLEAVAAAHVAGATIDVAELHRDRLIRSEIVRSEPSFLANNCEIGPNLDFIPMLTSTGSAEPDPAEVSEDESTLDVLRRFLADKAGLPIDTITSESRPLDELHLSSITIGQLVGEVSRALGRAPISGVPAFATASVGEIAQMLDESDASGRGVSREVAAGASSWVRSFEVVYVDEELSEVHSASGSSRWRGAGRSDEFTEALLRELEQTPGLPGLVFDSRALELDPFLEGVDTVLTWIRTSIKAEHDFRLVVIQHDRRGGAGLGRSVIQEHPDCPVTVVTVPEGDQAALGIVEQIRVDIATNRSFLEVRYDADGVRSIPRLSPISYGAGALDLHHGDVLLATGGGKGITAEACLTLATTFGVKVAMLGRADTDDQAVAATLRRFESLGVDHLYLSADVGEANSVRDAIGKIEANLGRITAFIHGAGVNQPAAAVDLTAQDFKQAIAPKVSGFENVMQAIDPTALKLVVGFGSIIGRGGLYGEAHYATANDWLRSDIAALRSEYPGLRAMCLEWSVWSGAGMGERLGVVERLKQRGIEPISTEWGLAELIRLVDSNTTPAGVVVSSRTGTIPTLEFENRDIPLHRYLDRILVSYPGTELIAESDLTAESDPYLLDHQLDGELLFPAVLGLEAMTQVASALVPRGEQVSLVDLKFERPIIVPPSGTETIRVAAVANHDGSVRVAIRASSTQFAADHFSGTVPARSQAPSRNHLPPERRHSTYVTPIALDPQRDLYGTVMFQQGRFRQLHSYKVASARTAVFDVRVGGTAKFFASFLPSELLLGDPGARDAFMHGLQCCVPDAILIPESVEAIHIDTSHATDLVTVTGVERAQQGDSYIYDLLVQTPDGTVVEAWEGLRLRAVTRHRATELTWHPAFIGSYLERSAGPGCDNGAVVIVEPHPREEKHPARRRRSHTATAVARALGGEASVAYRGDGRPQLPDGACLTSSHTGGLTLTIVAPYPVACDVERVTHREEFVWRDLLGTPANDLANVTATEANEDFDTAATRIWGALECARKAGILEGAPHLGSVSDDGWVRFSVASRPIATWVCRTLSGESIAFCTMEGA